jgi:hypothetical protein
MERQTIRVGVILAIAMTGIVVSVLATTVLTAYQRIPNAGNVKAVRVGVYEDIDCSINITSIDWLFLEPEETVNKTVYIKNLGNMPLMINMATENWDPTLASEHITLNWNREGYVLTTTMPVVQAVLTLSVSPNIDGVTNFSFDIIITGTEHA